MRSSPPASSITRARSTISGRCAFRASRAPTPWGRSCARSTACSPGSPGTDVSRGPRRAAVHRPGDDPDRGRARPAPVRAARDPVGGGLLSRGRRRRRVPRGPGDPRARPRRAAPARTRRPRGEPARRTLRRCAVRARRFRGAARVAPGARMPPLARLVALWRDAGSAVVLTGAGLSTASGIPDFRSPGGRWERYQPVPLPEFLASERARETYWRYKGETWRLISAAEPNPAHQALAALARSGRIDLLVTQNVDGLHERSGFPPERLVNIHGTDSEVQCMACHRREPRAVAQEAWEAGVAVPRCDCGGPWKPATISFGQSLVAADLERAMAAAVSGRLLVAAGSSLVVGPVNQMVPAARAARAPGAVRAPAGTALRAGLD